MTINIPDDDRIGEVYVNFKKKMLTYLLICFVFLSCLSSCTPNFDVSVLQEDRHFKITGNDSERYYDYYIYDNLGKIVASDHVERMPPNIQYVSSDILEIRISGGTYANLCTYCNTLTNEFSKEYWNPFLIKDGLIVYYDEQKLIVSDIFHKKIFYKEFLREISTAVAPEFIELKDNNSKLEIQYFENSDDIIFETLDLN